MKAFKVAGELYIRCIPGKNLFHSTMVHEVVNRGDVFALRVSDQSLTILSGKLDVEHIEVEAMQISSSASSKTTDKITKVSKTVKEMKARLKQMEIPL